MAEGCSNKSEDVHDLEKPLLYIVKAKGCDTVTPYANAGPFGRLFFSWISPLISLGSGKKTLDLEDIPQLGTNNSVFGAFPVFRKWLLSLSVANDNHSTSTRRVATTKFLLAKALFLSARKEILWTALMEIIFVVAQNVGPYLIDSFVQCLEGGEKLRNQGYVLASAFTIASLLEVFVRKHMIFRLQQVGIRLRGATTVMIYEKSLTLPSQSTNVQGDQASGSGGQLINAVAVDVETINSFIWYMHDTWSVFLRVAFALLILYKNLGLVASVAAFTVTSCLMLANSLFAKRQERFQKKLMESKDNRMKMTMETLRNMKILKLQGWEMSFLSKILQLRKMEMQWLKKFLYSSVIVTFLIAVSPVVVAMVTFGSCVAMSVPLEAGKILSALAAIWALQSPLFLLPETISMLIEFKVSLGRIASFLSLDEIQQDVLLKLQSGSSNMAIEIDDGNFTWCSSPLSLTATLKDINFKVSHGMRVAICGAVGSGKSSMLSCILGELPKKSGSIKLCGTKAYVPQSAWIQSGSIKDNILFGKEMDSERYDKILEACCLKKDLEVLPFSDQTVIGERGINLSGGQKQRVQIARALYNDADIFLFDDPFSALDAHTSSHIFKEVLLGLLNGKTVVYVTHQVEFLNAADQIVVMKDGKIAQAGKFDDILVPGSDFMELVGAQNEALSAIDCNRALPDSADDDGLTKIMQPDEATKGPQKSAADSSTPEAQLIEEEVREKGGVGFSIYWKFITATYAGALVFLALLFHVLSEAFEVGRNYWLAAAAPVSKDVRPVGESTLVVFVSLASGSILFSLAIDLLLATNVYKTAATLFNEMLHSIFRAPMSFFDATPSGRILNRCSKDQTAVETKIPSVLEGVASCAIELFGTMAVMAMVSWQVLLIFIPMVFASVWYQRYYIPSSRELTRLAGVCQAPVIQYFSETISGITTIRSFGQESRFQATYMKLVDSYSRPEFHVAAAMKWLIIRLDMFSCTTFACLLVLSVYFSERVDPAIAGLAVMYGLMLKNRLAGFIWCLSNSENKIISVERILQYMSIPSEAPLIVEPNRPACSWPSQGEIELHGLQVRYAPHLPLVLNGVTCTFPGGMKTGIVGRTGSGKSTLIQALFRIVEPTAGRIVIDGIDISSIGLQDLRSRLSIIPQDPTMFQGTIRCNLDPLEQYSDQQIWEVLDKCQLGDEVRKMEKKLDSHVSENGENWSMGQRQLVCLGRVLLKKSKVLVLDEATASVDTATDNQIQQTLKHHFSHCTLIIIAHRITSVLDSDMVLVLNQGRIEEYDSPRKLLRNKSSSFSQLVAEYSRRSSEYRAFEVQGEEPI